MDCRSSVFLGIIAGVFLLMFSQPASTQGPVVVCPQNYTLLANPNNCSSFYECFNQHYPPLLKLCPPGTHFSEAIQLCTYPQVAMCRLGTSGHNSASTHPPRPSTTVPLTTGTTSSFPTQFTDNPTDPISTWPSATTGSIFIRRTTRSKQIFTQPTFRPNPSTTTTTTRSTPTTRKPPQTFIPFTQIFTQPPNPTNQIFTNAPTNPIFTNAPTNSIFTNAQTDPPIFVTNAPTNPPPTNVPTNPPIFVTNTNRRIFPTRQAITNPTFFPQTFIPATNPTNPPILFTTGKPTIQTNPVSTQPTNPTNSNTNTNTNKLIKRTDNGSVFPTNPSETQTPITGSANQNNLVHISISNPYGWLYINETNCNKIAVELFITLRTQVARLHAGCDQNCLNALPNFNVICNNYYVVNN